MSKSTRMTRTGQSEPPHNIAVACLHAQARSDDAEKVQRQEQYLGIVKRLPLCEFAHCLGGAAFSGDRGDEPAAFFRGEELCLVRLIREDEKCDYSDPHGWDRFGDVHDLPTPQTEQAIQAEKSRRYRRADRHPRSSEKRIGRIVPSRESREVLHHF
jgi:hypothetical protein